MKKILAAISMVLVAACGSSNQNASATMSGDAVGPSTGDVSVSRDSSEDYVGTLKNAPAATLQAALNQASYTSAKGGLKIDCQGGSCAIVVYATAADLSTVHRPEDGGNTSLLQVRLTGDEAKDFYTNRTSVQETFVSDDLGLKTYTKQVVNAQGESAGVNIECFKKVMPHLLVLSSTTYECAVALNGYGAQ